MKYFYRKKVLSIHTKSLPEGEDGAEKLMKKKITRRAFCSMLLALSVSARAQEAGKIFRIGFLDGSTASGIAVLVQAFLQEVRKLGWIEGKEYYRRVPICRAKA